MKKRKPSEAWEEKREEILEQKKEAGRLSEVQTEAAGSTEQAAEAEAAAGEDEHGKALKTEAPAEAELPDERAEETPSDAARPHIVPERIDYIPPSALRPGEEMPSLRLEPPEEGGGPEAYLSSRGEKEEIPEHPLPAAEDVYVTEDKHYVLLEILDWLKYILIAAIIGLSLNHFVIQRSEVEGSSMVPTLFDKDQLLVEKVTVHFGLPDRGSIITVDASKLETRQEDQLYVKRIVGLPGESIDFQDGKVLIDGEILSEPYLPEDVLTEAPAGWSGPLKIPENHVFVLGDNRMSSADSRLYGPVPGSALNGHVLVRIYPFSRFGVPE